MNKNAEPGFFNQAASFLDGTNSTNTSNTLSPSDNGNHSSLHDLGVVLGMAAATGAVFIILCLVMLFKKKTSTEDSINKNHDPSLSGYNTFSNNNA